MSKRSLHYSSMPTQIIFIVLIMLALINVPINPFHFMVGVEYAPSFISFIPKITAKSDADNIITPHHIIDEVIPTNLEKTVHDLSFFHTRHTESEFIDDVAYWLVEKLQNVCSRDVYIHNFTQISDEDDNVDTQQQRKKKKKRCIPIT